MKIARHLIERRINAFERAVINRADKGCMHPDDWPAIEADYTKAREKLLRYIIDLALTETES